MEDKILEKLCYTFFSIKTTAVEVKCELEKISNKQRSEWGERSPLVSAVQAKRKDLIKLMVQDLGFDIDSTCKQFPYSALAAAIRHNDEDMVRFLVGEMKAKVNINYCKDKYLSPLICAFEQNKFQLVKLLVEDLGADVNFKVSHQKDGPRQFLALHWAIFGIFKK
jgi:hypothetical protein